MCFARVRQSTAQRRGAGDVHNHEDTRLLQH